MCVYKREGGEERERERENACDTTGEPIAGFFLEIFRRGGRSIDRHALDVTNVCA